MKKISVALGLLCFAFTGWAQQAPFEKNSTKNITATYDQIMPFFEALAKKYDQIKIFRQGLTDSGKPLHLVVLSKDKNFDALTIQKQNRRIILINNGIHPGEPEGIDASMMLARDLLEKKLLPDNVVICFIPVYNIGGSLNRGVSRVNQNGPDTYGFRGNARNLDLNRDFIKTDSKNSYSFQQIFNAWKPDVLIDNHTSNGADYQYVITLIETQKNKLSPLLSQFMTKDFTPALYERMKASGFEMTPYVNFNGETPDSGLYGFLETPRYSTGYAALHNTLAYMTETHMWKPFPERVGATYQFMKHVIGLTATHAEEIGKARKLAIEKVKSQDEFPVQWKLNTDKFDTLTFKGYEASHKPSEISGLPRLYYDRNKPFEKLIRSYNVFEPSVVIKKPAAYVIPQAWDKVVNLLKLNGVNMSRLKRDTDLEVEMYYIEDYNSAPRPYEGHYLHSNTRVQPKRQKIRFFEGDYLVYVNQAQNRYIVETLEPQAVDSFFNWNFFDSVLGQKEYFSAYIFEDEAARMLHGNADLRKRFEEAKIQDPEIGKSASAQLNWIYKNSLYYEKTHMRYPIGRLMNEVKIELR
ncbi:MAG TPA: M14 family metallopeptidase [Sphingobacteriaceae bacterium]